MSYRDEPGLRVYPVRIECRQDHALDAMALGPLDAPVGDHGAKAAATMAGVDVDITEPDERRLIGHDPGHRSLLPVRGVDARGDRVGERALDHLPGAPFGPVSIGADPPHHTIQVEIGRVFAQSVVAHPAIFRTYELSANIQSRNCGAVHLRTPASVTLGRACWIPCGPPRCVGRPSSTGERPARRTLVAGCRAGGTRGGQRPLP